MKYTPAKLYKTYNKRSLHKDSITTCVCYIYTHHRTWKAVADMQTDTLEIRAVPSKFRKIRDTDYDSKSPVLYGRSDFLFLSYTGKYAELLYYTDCRLTFKASEFIRDPLESLCQLTDMHDNWSEYQYVTDGFPRIPKTRSH